jgi:hypothetical protein
MPPYSPDPVQLAAVRALTNTVKPLILEVMGVSTSAKWLPVTMPGELATKLIYYTLGDTP